MHEEDDDTMTIDKSAEAAMQILNGLNPMAINPLLPPHMTGNIGVILPKVGFGFSQPI